MPIHIQRKGKKWMVINSITGRVFGTHPNKKKAHRQWVAMKAKGVDMEGKKEK